MQCARYIDLLITVRYSVSKVSISSFYSLRWKISSFISSEQTIIGKLSEWDLSIWKHFRNFFVYVKDALTHYLKNTRSLDQDCCDKALKSMT